MTENAIRPAHRGSPTTVASSNGAIGDLAVASPSIFALNLYPGRAAGDGESAAFSVSIDEPLDAFGILSGSNEVRPA